MNIQILAKTVSRPVETDFAFGVLAGLALARAILQLDSPPGAYASAETKCLPKSSGALRESDMSETS